MSDKKVVYQHICPVCEYATDEVYLERSTYIETKGRWKTTRRFLKELKGRLPPFDRFQYGDRAFLVCPNCGVVLSNKCCEVELEWSAEKGEHDL